MKFRIKLPLLISIVIVLISIFLFIKGCTYTTKTPIISTQMDDIKDLRQEAKKRFDNLCLSMEKNKSLLFTDSIAIDSLITLIRKKQIYLDSLFNELGKIKEDNAFIIEEIYKTLTLESKVTAKYLAAAENLGMSKKRFDDSSTVNTDIELNIKKLEYGIHDLEEGIKNKNEIPFTMTDIFINKLTRGKKHTNNCSNTFLIGTTIILSDCLNSEYYISVKAWSKSSPDHILPLGENPEYVILATDKKVIANIPIKPEVVADLSYLEFYISSYPKIPRKRVPCQEICQ